VDICRIPIPAATGPKVPLSQLSQVYNLKTESTKTYEAIMNEKYFPALQTSSRKLALPRQRGARVPGTKRLVCVAVEFITGLIVLTATRAATAEPALFQAIRNGDKAAIRAQATNAISVNARDEWGNTPLMVAAANGDIAVLELLLNAGAEVNATNKAGATALMRAATDEQQVRLLVNRGADVKARSQLGNAVLILAARPYGSTRTVKLLLDHGADVNATNNYGATPLMAAVAAEDIETVRLLLDRGADVNAKPNMNGDGFIWGGGRTPLMWAAFRGNLELIQLLLERGAKVNDFTLAGSALSHAAWAGHAKAARVLLEAGAQVDQQDLLANYTPLHWAASSERTATDLVELLLARGADPNAEGGQPVDGFLGISQTPLMLARKRGDTPIVHALLKSGAREPALPEKRPADPVRPASKSINNANLGHAIQAALPMLQTTAAESYGVFRKHVSKQDCVSCHQQQIPMAALGLARSRGFVSDPDAARKQVEFVLRDIAVNQERDWQATFHPEPAVADGYALLGLYLEKQGASAVTDAYAYHLAAIQAQDGRWCYNLPRPPIQSSDIGATALAVHALKFYAPPARQHEMQKRIERARVWLRKNEPEITEERAYQLLGLAWAGERPEALKKLAEQLIQEQRSDGGWGELPKLPSDAFGTGQALYALLEAAGLSAKHAAIQKGIRFLVQTQLEDGTWHVRRRTFPFQPPMDSGFPHGADSWLSSAATSWATMALVSALPASYTPPQAAPLIASTRHISHPSATRTRLDPVPPESEQNLQPTISAVDFAQDIKPILERSCVSCHSGDRPKGGYSLSRRSFLLKPGNRGESDVVPGRSVESPLLRFVSDQVEDLEMPPLGKREKFPALTKNEIERLRLWIDQGAPWPEESTLRAATQGGP
jgi:ankyrin repeat protein